MDFFIIKYKYIRLIKKVVIIINNLIIKFSSHANKRLKQSRQKGITKLDVVKNAKKIPYSPITFKVRCETSKGKVFQMVIVDRENIRNIITLIG